MDIHKPKPVHGWREFASEIGVVVIGVCIALAGEQAVEAWHWAGRIREAEASMTRELGVDNGAQAKARLAISPCIASELNGLQAVLASSDVSTTSLHLPMLVAPPFRTWDNDAWRAAETSGASSHMTTETMYNWAGPYTLIGDMNQTANLEFRDWAPLLQAGTLGARLSESERAHLIAAIASARRDNELLTFLSSKFVEFSRDAGVTIPVKASDAEVARELKEMVCGAT